MGRMTSSRDKGLNFVFSSGTRRVWNRLRIRWLSVELRQGREEKGREEEEEDKRREEEKKKKRRRREEKGNEKKSEEKRRKKGERRRSEEKRIVISFVVEVGETRKMFVTTQLPR